jgi:hypothetical protein
MQRTDWPSDWNLKMFCRALREGAQGRCQGDTPGIRACVSPARGQAVAVAVNDNDNDRQWA